MCFNKFSCATILHFKSKQMSLFETLLEIKTEKKDLLLKAVYVSECNSL